MGEAFASAALDGIDADDSCRGGPLRRDVRAGRGPWRRRRRADRRPPRRSRRGGRVFRFSDGNSRLIFSHPTFDRPRRPGRIHSTPGGPSAPSFQRRSCFARGNPHAVSRHPSRQDRGGTGCPLRRRWTIRTHGRRRDRPRQPFDRQLQGRARAVRQIGGHPPVPDGARHRSRRRRRDIRRAGFSLRARR